jgi:hypothetical protein
LRRLDHRLEPWLGRSLQGGEAFREDAQVTDEQRKCWEEGYASRMVGQPIPDPPYDDEDERADFWVRGWHWCDADLSDRARARH